MDNIFYYLLGKKRGGGGAGMPTVTFMSDDGKTVLHKMSVMVGMDCPDPVEFGIIPEPTKKPTAEYEYAYVGWATTEGGAWDENALKNVITDRVVYATYAATVRVITYTKLLNRYITEYSDETVKSVGTSAFNRCYNITAVNLPAVTSIDQEAFSSCNNLITADFSSVTYIAAAAFAYCGKLTAFILRKADAICSLRNGYAFNGTPIANGTGYIYVPAALVDTYKAATNWATYSAQFRSLESYTVDGTTTGALDPNKI